MLSSLSHAGVRLGRRVLLVVVGVVMVTMRAWAAEPVPAPPPERPIAVVNVDVYPVDGPVISGGTVVWERGLITAMGRDVEIPAAAERIDGTGARLYPVLIACGTQLGLVEIDAVRATRDQSEVGDLNPNVRAEVSVNPDSALIPVTRSNGIGLVQTMPTGGLISGSSALLRLDGWTWEEMLVAPLGVHVRWPTMRVPDSIDPEKTAEQREQRDRNLRSLDDLFDRARAYAQRSPAPDTGPDLRCEALLPVIRGRPVFLHADAWRDIEAAVGWAVANGLRAVVVGGKDAPLVTRLLVENDVPVIYGPVHALPRTRSDAYDDPFTGPLRLHEAGVRFAIASFDTSNARNLPYEAATAAAYGLPREVALRSITLSAAEILGVSDRVGSVAVGKLASLQLTDGDPLEITTRVLRLWLDGRPVDLSNRQTELYEKYADRIRRDEATRRDRF